MPLPTSAKSRAQSRVKRECPVEISIDRHFEAKAYTSGSAVAGQVTFSPQSDFTFDTVDIVLVGCASAQVQLLQREIPRSNHTFLELRMPFPEDALPYTGILEAGNSYTVPFSFIIPFQLPSASCKHRSTVIRDRHLQLPPTVGGWEHDDLAIHSVGVEYSVRARAVMKVDQQTTSIEKKHIIKVMPYFPEQPPLHILPGNPMYQLSQEKMIRKDMLSSRNGYLKASTSQPDPIVLSADKLEAPECTLTVDLEFSPTSKKIKPPQIYAKSGYIQALTNYSVGHIGFLPDQHKHPRVSPNPILTYFMDEQVTLGESGELHWEQESPCSSAESSRRSSASVSQQPPERARKGSNHSMGSDSAIATTSIKYKAKLVVPFNLPGPDKKAFLPTFYSCLVCRTYTLRLIIGAGSHGSTLAFTIPVQIAVEGCYTPPIDATPNYTQIDSEQELDDQMLPPYEFVL
ncbi:hypothetical protein FDECE_11034 [Fusarium decemcellulare]|nr:hypothetical protein FDECE_11034 [Fusarium decemcellulare]